MDSAMRLKAQTVCLRFTYLKYNFKLYESNHFLFISGELVGQFRLFSLDMSSRLKEEKLLNSKFKFH